MLFQKVVKEYSLGFGKPNVPRRLCGKLADYTLQCVQAQGKIENGHGRPRNTMAVGEQL